MCTVNNEEANFVSSNAVYCVLRILMDPLKLSTLQTMDLIKEYLLKYNESEAETITHDVHFSQQLIKLIEIWRDLQIDSFAYRQIGYLKPRLAEEMC